MKHPKTETEAKLLVDELGALQAHIKLLEARSKELKKAVREFMGDSKILTSEGYCMLVEYCERKSLDRAALEERVGTDVVEECTKVTPYERILVREAK